MYTEHFVHETLCILSSINPFFGSLETKSEREKENEKKREK